MDERLKRTKGTTAGRREKGKIEEGRDEVRNKQEENRKPNKTELREKHTNWILRRGDARL